MTFATLVIVLFAFIAVVNTPPFHRGTERSHYESDYEELGDSPRWFLKYPTVKAALRKANEQLSSIDIAGVQTLDPHREHISADCIWDHSNGGIYVWELTDYFTTVSLNGDTGEIVSYSRLDERNGTLSKDDAEALALEVAEAFAPLPQDRGLPTTEWNYFAREALDLDTDELINISVPYWMTWIPRIKKGIESTDHIFIEISMAGHLNCYYKEWNLDLSKVKVEYTVTQEEAIDSALRWLFPEGVNRSIVEPNITVDKAILWRNVDDGRGPYYYSDDLSCVWYMFIPDEYGHPRALIGVDSITNEVIYESGYS